MTFLELYSKELSMFPTQQHRPARSDLKQPKSKLNTTPRILNTEQRHMNWDNLCKKNQWTLDRNGGSLCCSHLGLFTSSLPPQLGQSSTFTRAGPHRKAAAAELHPEHRHRDRENPGDYAHSGGCACWAGRPRVSHSRRDRLPWNSSTAIWNQ